MCSLLPKPREYDHLLFFLHRNPLFVIFQNPIVQLLIFFAVFSNLKGNLQLPLLIYFVAFSSPSMSIYWRGKNSKIVWKVFREVEKNKLNEVASRRKKHKPTKINCKGSSIYIYIYIYIYLNWVYTYILKLSLR